MNEVAWGALALLGAFHGINPAMGWLFAVSLGLQERDRGAVVRALGPLALGHAAAIGAVVAVFAVASASFSGDALRYGAAALLLGFGAFKLARPFKHPRWARMRVGAGQLALWSFLMASAHGAGLMLLPALGGLEPSQAVGHEPHIALAGSVNAVGPAALAVGVHTAGMLVVAGVVALAVYERLGVEILRRSWFNVDLLWAIALMVAGVYVLLLGLST